jgi:hypothetical protein
MLTRIVRPSPQLNAFLDRIAPSLSRPQRQHLLRLADSLLVCEDSKTLAALQRQFLDAPDPSNLADFLRQSPWSVTDLRDCLRDDQIAFAIEYAQRLGLPRILYLNIDDSLGEKDKNTRHIEPVAWFHDHNESTPRCRRYKNAFCYLECTLKVAEVVLTLDLRLYLREQTVRRLNRNRTAQERLRFRSKYRLAREMLEAIRPMLPKDWAVYVQFDSWYASEKLIRYVRRQGWHVLCGLKSNRNLDDIPLKELSDVMWHKRYKAVSLPAAGGKETICCVRERTGKVNGISELVRVYLCKRHPREKAPAYFMSTDLTRSATQALRGYRGRWSCEVVNFYAKTQLGLADFRVRSYEAVDRYVAVVLLAWAYVERRYVNERGGQVKTYGDIIRRHRDEHAEAWLREAVQQAIREGAIEAVLQRFLRQPHLTA